MDVLNWMGEHPFLTFFVVVGVANGLGRLGRIGSTTIVYKHKDDEDDE